MESYFSEIEPSTETWNNIHSLICHTTHVYSNLKYKCEELENTDKKIKSMEEKLKLLKINWKRINMNIKQRYF